MHKMLSAVVVVALAVGGAACGSYTGGPIPDGPATDVYNITPGASVIIGSGGRFESLQRMGLGGLVST
jgi:hypothetical protein